MSRRDKQRSLFSDQPEAIAMATHCVHCHERLGQLEGRWNDEQKGWLCERCK